MPLPFRGRGRRLLAGHAGPGFESAKDTSDWQSKAAKRSKGVAGEWHLHAPARRRCRPRAPPPPPRLQQSRHASALWLLYSSGPCRGRAGGWRRRAACSAGGGRQALSGSRAASGGAVRASRCRRRLTTVPEARAGGQPSHRRRSKGPGSTTHRPACLLDSIGVPPSCADPAGVKQAHKAPARAAKHAQGCAAGAALMPLVPFAACTAPAVGGSSLTLPLQSLQSLGDPQRCVSRMLHTGV